MLSLVHHFVDSVDHVDRADHAALRYYRSAGASVSGTYCTPKDLVFLTLPSSFLSYTQMNWLRFSATGMNILHLVTTPPSVAAAEETRKRKRSSANSPTRRLQLLYQRPMRLGGRRANVDGIVRPPLAPTFSAICLDKAHSPTR